MADIIRRYRVIGRDARYQVTYNAIHCALSVDDAAQRAHVYYNANAAHTAVYRVMLADGSGRDVTIARS